MTYLRFTFLDSTWWRALERLRVALGEGSGAGRASAVTDAYRALAGEIAAARSPDLATLIAAALIDEPAPFQVGPDGSPAAGVLALLEADMSTLAELASREYAAAVGGLPRLSDLAFPAEEGERRDALSGLAAALARGAAVEATDAFLVVLRERGSGPAALNPALRYSGGRLTAVAAPHGASLDDLVGLDDQLALLTANTEALLDRRPSHNTLLYGPRGSGKSTAVRGLLGRYGRRGLRLVELPVDELHHLARLLDELRALPQSFVLFVDDLGFEDGDSGYRALRTLLEGGLSGRPSNVALYATSNRRHLVKERFSDRPDPLDDDVHGWDTQHEKLALADRFGLTLTFPDAGQRRYLELVSALASARSLSVDDLERRAIRFAEWGNGYSGRTARQFIDTLLQDRGVAERLR